MNYAAAITAAAVFLPTRILGLSAEDVSRPSPPPEARATERAVAHDDATRGATRAAEDQELLPALKGLVISAIEENTLHLQQRGAAGIVVVGFSDAESAALSKIAAGEIGKPVSLRSLDLLTTRIEAEFRSRGRMFVRISFPPQEITGGVIAIRIVPAKAGRVTLTGNPAFGMDFAAAGFRTRPGETVSDGQILDDLDWLNKNPLRRASISFGDGEGEDELDLKLHLNSPKAWRVYGGIDNQLSESLGDERLYLGWQHGDLFSLDHRLTAQYTAALKLDRLQGFSGVYEIPLPIRHLLQVSAGYTESESDVAGPLDQSGEFTRVAMNYVVPLPRWKSTSHEWRAGMEFRNNDYLFPDNSSQDVRFFQIETGWRGRRSDRHGLTRFDFSIAYSPGQGILGSEDADFIALGGSGAEALIARLDVERTFKMGKYGTLSGRVRGQWADSDLLSSDQITAAGATRVRGFDETVGYASNGLVGTLEAQSPTLKTTSAGDFVAALFIDGAVLDRDFPTDVGELVSAGCGLRWRMEERVSAKLDLGIPITYPDTEDGDPLLHFSIGTTW